MRASFVLCFAFIFPLAARAAERPIVVTPPPGWKGKPISAQEQSAMASSFNLKFERMQPPCAMVMVSVIGELGNRVKDLATLREIHPMQSRQFITSPDDHAPINTLPAKDGIGVYSVHVDPTLIGKPIDPETRS